MINHDLLWIQLKLENPGFTKLISCAIGSDTFFFCVSAFDAIKLSSDTIFTY